jgi:threonyl-tRNA synthetase
MLEKGQRLLASLKENGLRAELDEADEPLGAKVHRFEEARVPYAVILGHSEVTKGRITVRKSHTGEVTKGVTAEALVKQLLEEAARNERII